ncbi:MAG: hypothetical protein L0Z62_12915 [Gemmataceae bacterium]|nr:hypothetical protein [Gemmataceae bacterium]
MNMENVYLVCALVGGTLLVAQFLLGLVGFGDHHDVTGDHDVGMDHDAGHAVGHEHAGAWFLGVLTLRTVAAALTFFGLVGWALREPMGDELLTAAVATAAGLGALLAVAWLMKLLQKLQAEGTVRIERAVGRPGTVYLKIPARKAGPGKVTLMLQNRTVEYQAITAEEELPTGAQVVVVAVVSPDTLEVASATRTERTAHV